MIYDKTKTLDFLDEKGVDYEILEHDPVYTIEDMVEAGITDRGLVCKNLFLRDAKGKTHYLVVTTEDKRVNLKQFAKTIGSSRLSFASAERLLKYLGLQEGSVSPLGVLNDSEHSVIVVFDSELSGKLGIHPNENTATIWIDYDTLKRIISKHGNEIVEVKM